MSNSHSQWSYDELDGDTPPSPSMLPTQVPVESGIRIPNANTPPKTPEAYASFPGSFPPSNKVEAWAYNELDTETDRLAEEGGITTPIRQSPIITPPNRSPPNRSPPPLVRERVRPPPPSARPRPPPLEVPIPSEYLKSPDNDFGRDALDEFDAGWTFAPTIAGNVGWGSMLSNPPPIPELEKVDESDESNRPNLPPLPELPMVPSLDLSVEREHGVNVDDSKLRSSSVNLPLRHEDISSRSAPPPLLPDSSSSLGVESGITNREDEVMLTSLEGHRYLSIPEVFRLVTLGGRLSIKDRISLGSHIAMKFVEGGEKVTIKSAWNPIVGSSSEIKIRWYKWCDYPVVAIGCLEWFAMNMERVVY